MMARVSDIVNSSAYRGNRFRSSCVHRLSLTQDPASSLRDIIRRPNPQPLKAHRYLVLNESIFFVLRVPSTEQCDSSINKGVVVGRTVWIHFLNTTTNCIPADACRTILQGNQFSSVVGKFARWKGDQQELQEHNLGLTTFQIYILFLRTPQCAVGQRRGLRVLPHLASTQFHTG